MRNQLVSTLVTLKSATRWLALVAALLLSGSLGRATNATLYWDGTGAHSGANGLTDATGTWSTAHWYNGTSDITWPSGTPYYNASIGAGGTGTKIRVITALDVGNITFNTMGSGQAYDISASSAAGVTMTMHGDGGAPTVYANNVSTAPSILGASSSGMIVACGSQTFTKAGLGELRFSSATVISTANPAVEIVDGKLSLTAMANQLPTNGVLQIDFGGSGATGTGFNLNGQNQAVAGLTTGSGSGGNLPFVDCQGTTTATFTIGGSTSYTFAGQLKSSSSTGVPMNLILTNSVTENLTGTTPHTISGTTILQNTATLNFVSAGTCVSNAITLNSGTTLGVTLSAANGQWVCSNLTFAAGTSALNLSYNNTAPSGSVAPISVIGQTPAGAAGNGILTASGTVNLTITSIANNGLTLGNTYPLIAYTGADPSPSSFHLAFGQGGIGAYITTGSGLVSMTVTNYCSESISLSPSSPLAAGTAGTTYAGSAITASGGTGPYSFSVTAGSLPAGLTLNTDGTWSGAPTAAGTFNFTVTASDTGSPGCSGVQVYSLTVAPGAVASYTVTAATPQNQDAAFNVTVTAKDSNGNTVTTDSNTAVTLSSSTGNITFPANPVTPASGTFTTSVFDGTAESVTITATDGNGKTGTSSTIVVNAATTLYWDPAAALGTGSDATGTWNWNTTPGNSWSANNGSADVTWVSGDLAAFGTSSTASAYTVKLDSAVTVGAITFNQMGGGHYNLSSSGLLTLTSGTITDNNTSYAAGDVMTRSVIACGGVTFTKNGSGALQLSSGCTITTTANPAMEVKNGTVQLQKAAITLPSGGVLQVDKSGTSTPTVDLNAQSQVVGGLTSGGSGANPATVTSTAAGGVLDVTGTGTYTFGGAITGGANMGLTMGGTGTQILTGTSTYTGNTTVSSGKLLVNGTLGASAVSVASAASFGGTGTAGGAVSYSGGSHAILTLTPSGGTSGANTTPLTIGGTLTVDNSGTFPDVRLAVPTGLADGTYTLATYTASGSAGSFNGTPVVTSGSFADGTAIQAVTTSGGVVSLYVGPCTAAGIGSSPANVSSWTGGTATFSVTATGSAPSYQWKVSTDGGTTWNNVTGGSGATSSTYTTAAFTGVENGYQYECVVSVACDSTSATSSAATLTLVDPSTVQFRTQASGAWENASTWQYNIGGAGWVSAAATPSAINGTIEIQSGHTVTVNQSVAVDQTTIDAGGEVDLNAGTLTINHATGTDCDVSGTLKQLGGTLTVSGGALVTFENGGGFDLATNGGAIPVATWDASSTCTYAPATAGTNTPSGLDQTFGNFVWNWPGQSGSVVGVGQAGLTNIVGNFELTAGSSFSIGLKSPNDTVGGTMNIGGALKIHAGSGKWITVGGTAASGNTGVWHINIGNGLQVDAGANLDFGSYTSPGGVNVEFTGNGAFTLNGAMNDSFASFLVDAGKTLTLNTNFPVSTNMTLEVAGTLACGPYMVTNANVNATGIFTLDSGATLEIGDPNGITATAASGNIQTTTRNFSTSANYVYTGSSAQVLGNGLPATVNNLTLASGMSVPVTVGNSPFTDTPVYDVTGTLTAGSAVISYTVSGAKLVHGTFPVFSHYGILSGSFGTPNLVSGTESAAPTVSTSGNAVALVIANSPPVANADSVTRNSGASVKVTFASLLANDTDADGDALTITAIDSATAGGKTLALDGASVATSTLVVVPANTADLDTFTYTVSDGQGGTAVGTVTIHVVSVAGQGQTVSVSGSTATVTFSGIPGYGYHVQRSLDLSTWTTIASVTAAAGNGGITNVDNFSDLGVPPALPPSSAYYRLMYP